MVRTEIQLFLKNAPGELGRLASALAHEGINIDALTIQDASAYVQELFKRLRAQRRGYLECSAPIESAIGAQDVAMGVEVQEIAEGLDGNDCTGSSLLFWNKAREKLLQAIAGTATQFGEKFSIIKKVTPDKLWDVESAMIPKESWRSDDFPLPIESFILFR